MPLTYEDAICNGRPISWTAADGCRFPGLAWEPEDGRAQANVLCIHGLGGAAADFGPLGRHLCAHGCRVRALDLRGQGNDPEPHRRGHVLDPVLWREDLRVFAATFEDCAPLFVVGESMGALAAVDAVAHGALQPERLVLSVPVPETRAPVPSWIVGIIRAVAGWCPRAKLSPLRFVHGKCSLPRLTADDEYMAYLDRIPHRVRGFSLDFLARFHDLMHGCRCCAPEIRVPTLMLAAGRDIFIRPSQSRAFFDLLGCDEKRYLFYPHSHHLLWRDVDTEEVLQRITRWILEGEA